MLLLSGCHKVPDFKINWEMTPDKCERIPQNLHLCDKEHTA